MGRELWQIPKNERRLFHRNRKKATASNSLAGRSQMVLLGAELPAARNCDLVSKNAKKISTEGSSENSTSEKYFVVL